MADEGRLRVVVTLEAFSQDNGARNVCTTHEEANMKLEDVKALQKHLAQTLVDRASA